MATEAGKIKKVYDLSETVRLYRYATDSYPKRIVITFALMLCDNPQLVQVSFARLP